MIHVIRYFALGTVLLFPAFSIGGETKMEKVAHQGWPNCLRLTNGNIELLATTDVGPRIMQLRFVGGQNFMCEYPDQVGKTGGDKWNIFGGHRLWHAPEHPVRSYWPDNVPVKYNWDGKTLKLTQPVEKTTGIVKEIEISFGPEDNHVIVRHRLINTNLWDIETANWAISVLAPGGYAIVPQEEFKAKELLPARPMTLWHYTDMKDPRWTWGSKYIQLTQDPGAPANTKLGVMNTLRWCAYALKGELFMKRFDYQPDAKYPDFGCNNEIFTNPNMLELETLGAIERVAKDGGAIEHVEHWFLFKIDVGQDEKEIDANVLPLVRQTDKCLSQK